MADTVGIRFDGGRAWTVEDDDIIRARRRADVPFSAIAIELGRSKNAVIGRFRRVFSQDDVYYRDKVDAVVLGHLRDGKTHGEIGELLGVSKAAISKRVERYRRDGLMPAARPGIIEQKATVLALFHQGATHDEIAVAVGFHRKSVANLICQLRKAGELPPAARVVRQHAVLKPKPLVPFPHKTRLERLEERRQVKEVVYGAAQRPHMAGLPLERLTARSCRYACNDAGRDEERLFCGARSNLGTSYCAAHWPLLWRPRAAA